MVPTPVFFPGEFHGQRILAEYSPWGPKELDTNKRLTHTIRLGLHFVLHSVKLLISIVEVLICKHELCIHIIISDVSIIIKQ